MSVDLLNTELGDLLSLPARSSSDSGAVCSVRMLQHFQAFTCYTLGSTKCKGVMHSFVARESWLHPHLMHMVLAVSAAHLKRLYHDSSQVDYHQQYRIAEASHWDRALHFHRKAFSNDVLNFDATLATTFLAIIFTFSLDDHVLVDASTGNDKDTFQHALEPLAATLGFRALRGYFGKPCSGFLCLPVELHHILRHVALKGG